MFFILFSRISQFICIHFVKVSNLMKTVAIPCLDCWHFLSFSSVVIVGTIYLIKQRSRYNEKSSFSYKIWLIKFFLSCCLSSTLFWDFHWKLFIRFCQWRPEQSTYLQSAYQLPAASGVTCSPQDIQEAAADNPVEAWVPAHASSPTREDVGESGGRLQDWGKGKCDSNSEGKVNVWRKIIILRAR